jgi:hypothetical protein
VATDFTGEIKDLRTTIASVREVTDLASLEEQLHELEQQAADPTDDRKRAQRVTSGLSRAKAEQDRVVGMDSRVEDLEVLVEMGQEEDGADTMVMDTSDAEEAGLKSATFEVNTPYAYANLSVEVGTHRLVRISPFDNQGCRQTSFAAVRHRPMGRRRGHPPRAARVGEGVAVLRLDGQPAPSGQPAAAGADTEPTAPGFVDG